MIEVVGEEAGNIAVAKKMTLTEKDFSVGEKVFWRNPDDTITDGEVKKVALEKANTYISVLWDDCAGNATYRSSEGEKGMFHQVEKYDVAVSKKYGVLFVTNVECEMVN